MQKLKILVVEDDQLMLEGIRLTLESQEDMEVWGTATNGYDALALLDNGKPDLMLLDIQLPGINGIDLIREIRKTDEALPILVLTGFLKDDYIKDALAYGANGYLLKGINAAKLTQSIRDAISRQFILPWEVASRVIKQSLHPQSGMPPKALVQFFQSDNLFSEKEQEIILHLLNRLSNQEIAGKIYLSEGTVKNNISTIYKKLGVKRRSEAIKKLESLISDERL